jgi:UDP-3-O-acyl-N-acetylglucosamine deacetylase
MFIGDTKCWHKGTPLKKGHRLVLELEYTSSLFGANYPKMEVNNTTQAFKDFCAKNKTFATHLYFKN